LTIPILEAIECTGRLARRRWRLIASLIIIGAQRRGACKADDRHHSSPDKYDPHSAHGFLSGMDFQNRPT
jgi:hypothetical protein